MTITYLDEKPDAKQNTAETTVPALAAEPLMKSLMPAIVPQPAISEKSVRMLQPILPKRGRGRPPKAQMERPVKTHRGRGRPPKADHDPVLPLKRGRGRPPKVIVESRIERKQSTKKVKQPMNTSISSENRRGRKSEGKTCKLVCLITGTTRTAGSGYLSSKPAEFRSNYISRPALKLLRQGMTVRQVREQLQQGLDMSEPAPDLLQSAIAINGKHKK
jgi:hypothetical protein